MAHNLCTGRPPTGAEWRLEHTIDDETKGVLWDVYVAPGSAPGWDKVKVVARGQVRGGANYTLSVYRPNGVFERWGLGNCARMRGNRTLYVKVKHLLQGFCPVDGRTGYLTVNGRLMRVTHL